MYIRYVVTFIIKRETIVKYILSRRKHCESRKISVTYSKKKSWDMQIVSLTFQKMEKHM